MTDRAIALAAVCRPPRVGHGRGVGVVECWNAGLLECLRTILGGGRVAATVIEATSLGSGREGGTGATAGAGRVSVG